MKDALATRVPETATKGFGELEAEVINAGLCTDCRACVDLCAADGPDALSMDLGSFQFDADKCTECGLCYAVCPEIPSVWDDLWDRFDVEGSPIGKERMLTSAVTRSGVIKGKSADGGVATSLLWYLLDSGQITAAILSKANGPLGPNLFVARSREEILQASGLRAGRGASMATGRGVVTNLDLMALLRKLHKEDPGNRDTYALVATPCQAYTVRRMQQIGVAPAPRVEMILGLFCYEALPLNKVQWQRFEEATNLRVEDVEHIQMREELVLTMKDGRTKRVDLDTASLLAGPNCLRCTDFTNRFADLAVGAVGSDPGFTTVLIRTERARALYDAALEAGYIAEWTSMFGDGGDGSLVERLRTRLEEQTRRKVELAERAGAKRT